MAKWFNDFSQYTANSRLESHDWTQWWNTGPNAWVRTSGGESYVELTTSSNARSSWTYDSISSLDSSDYPIRVRSEFTIVSSGAGQWPVAAHISGATGTESQYDARDNNGVLQLAKYDDGSFSNLAQAGGFFTTGIRYQALLEVHSSGVRVKVWEASSSEPGTWTHSSADTSLTSGLPGLGIFTAAGELNVYWWSVGTDGDDAPDTPIPDVPDNFSLTTIDHESANGDWDTVTDADTYDLRWDTDDLFGNPTTISDIGDPPQVVSGLPAGRTVYAKVRACNAEGCSDWSDVDSADIDPPRAEISQRATARQSVVLAEIETVEATISQRARARQSVVAVPTMIGSIKGTVMLSGSPVEGAKVTIMHPPESAIEFDTTTTDVNGEYSFDNLLVVQEGYHVSVEYRDNGNLYNTTSLPYLTPVAE